MDDFKAIYRILKYLKSAMSYEEIDMGRISASALGLNENRWTAIMEMLVKNGLVDGISATYSCDGDVILSFNRPRITLQGLEYLQENSLMRKAANLAKGIAEIIP